MSRFFRRCQRSLWWVLFATLLSHPGVFGAEVDLPTKKFLSEKTSVDPTAVEKILVLYKKRDPEHQGILDIFTGLLMEAGYVFDTHDIEDLLDRSDSSSKEPSKEPMDMSPYSGIMTVYQSSQMIHGDLYPLWLVAQMEAGRRILIIGSYGAYQGLIQKPDDVLLEWNESTQVINTFFHPFGLEFYFAFSSDASKLRIVKADHDYAQYQSPLSQKDLRYYQFFKSVDARNKTFFELERTDVLDSKSALNVITPYGGMILEGYAYYWDPLRKKTVFRVNFPKFMKEVFSATSPPVPKFKIETHEELLAQFPLPEREPPVTLLRKVHPSELSRHILVMYKKTETKSVEAHPFFKRAGVILEYLGLIPHYRAVEDGLPDDATMAHFRGIATWHTTPYMFHAEAYGKWLLRQINKGKRIAILQEYGATFDQETEAPVPSRERVWEALGMRSVLHGKKRKDLVPELRLLDGIMMNFEKNLDPGTLRYMDATTSVNPHNKVFLSLKDADFGIVDLGIMTPDGGLSLSQSPFYFPVHDARRIALIRKALRGEIAPEIAEKKTLGAWQINPYRFFSEAFSLEDFPTPDITTLNGSRIFYTHIDGDGLASISLIDGSNRAGYFVYEKILKRYSGIPATISVITKFIEKSGNQYHHPAVVLARNIFKLPNIDVAVHTATHPFDWVGGDLQIVNPDVYPYEINYQPHNLLEEIWGSKLFADHNLVPPDKKATSIFWSGATNPDAKALEIVWRSGMHNLNGGDPRFDNEYPSLAGLAPYSLPYGPYRQFFTSAQNDYLYTRFLTGDLGGQRAVLKHFQKTDAPHRIVPMNLYYHFYSGIHKLSLDALTSVFDTILTMDAAAIFTTQFSEIVEDFYATHVGKDGNTYWIKNNGKLRTIRFNQKIHVDMSRSKGVIGYRHHENQTYVHLDASKRREIVLTEAPPQTPYIIQATQFIDTFHFEGAQLRFSLRGFGKTLLKIGGLKPESHYTLDLKAPERKPLSVSLKTDANGILEFRTQLAAPSVSYEGMLRQREKSSEK